MCVIIPPYPKIGLAGSEIQRFPLSQAAKRLFCFFYGMHCVAIEIEWSCISSVYIYICIYHLYISIDDISMYIICFLNFQ